MASSGVLVELLKRAGKSNLWQGKRSKWCKTAGAKYLNKTSKVNKPDKQICLRGESHSFPLALDQESGPEKLAHLTLSSEDDDVFSSPLLGAKVADSSQNLRQNILHQSFDLFVERNGILVFDPLVGRNDGFQGRLEVNLGHLHFFHVDLELLRAGVNLK